MLRDIGDKGTEIDNELQEGITMTKKHYTQADHEAYRQKVEAEEAKARTESTERSLKAASRVAWLAEGGTEREFESEWAKGTIQKEIKNSRVRRAVEADARAREEQARSFLSRI